MRPVYYIQVEDKNIDEGSSIGTLAGLKENLDANLNTIVFSNHAKEITKKYESTGIPTIIYENSKFDLTNLDGIVNATSEFLNSKKNYLVVFEDSNLGNSLASRLAAKLNKVYVPHISNIEKGPNSFTVSRNIGDTKAIRETPLKDSAVITVSFNGVLETDKKAKVKIVNLDKLQRSTNAYVPDSASNNDLAYAKVVVAGGKGLQEASGFQPLQELANKLNASVGATKAVTDQGWISADKMIGISNLTVSPEVYYAFGIAGAVQHTAGMNKSKHIIAVNTDKSAPIFKLADYGIVGDANKVIDGLLNLL